MDGSATNCYLEILEELCAGDEIGPYMLIKEIGNGAFSVVWEAESNEYKLN
jgi:hypothetical protein